MEISPAPAARSAPGSAASCSAVLHTAAVISGSPVAQGSAAHGIAVASSGGFKVSHSSKLTPVRRLRALLSSGPKAAAATSPPAPAPVSGRAAADNTPDQAGSNSIIAAAGTARVGSLAVSSLKTLVPGSQGFAVPLAATAVAYGAPLVMAEGASSSANGIAAFDRLTSVMQADSRPPTPEDFSADYHAAVSNLIMRRRCRVSSFAQPCHPGSKPVRKAAKQMHHNPFAGMGLDSRTAAAPLLPHRTRLDGVTQLTSIGHSAARKETRGVNLSQSQVPYADSNLLQTQVQPSQQHAAKDSLLSSLNSSTSAVDLSESSTTPDVASNSHVLFTPKPKLSFADGAVDTDVDSRFPLPDTAPLQMQFPNAHRTLGASLGVTARALHPSPSLLSSDIKPTSTPLAVSQSAAPSDRADPPPSTPSGAAAPLDISCAVPDESVKPARKTTPLFGGARKLFVRSKADKGRPRAVPRVPGQAGLRVPPAPLKAAAPPAVAAAVMRTPHKTSSPSARLRGLLGGGRQLDKAFSAL